MDFNETGSGRTVAVSEIQSVYPTGGAVVTDAPQPVDGAAFISGHCNTDGKHGVHRHGVTRTNGAGHQARAHE